LAGELGIIGRDIYHAGAANDNGVGLCTAPCRGAVHRPPQRIRFARCDWEWGAAVHARSE
jgi:hypothetical protein